MFTTTFQKCGFNVMKCLFTLCIFVTHSSVLSENVVPTSCVRIFSVHRIDHTNIGDMQSNPILYFEKLRNNIFDVVDIGANAQDVISKYDMKSEDVVIIGGGGLLWNNELWDRNIEIYCKRCRCILWGIGVNKRYDSREHKNMPTLKYLKKISVGAAFRDDTDGGQLDASCLHNGLTCQGKGRGVGMYMHTRHYDGHKRNDTLFNSEKSICTVIHHICRFQFVISSSYHGIIWATMLNRSVAMVNKFSTKFDHLPFKVPSSNKITNVTYSDLNGTRIRDECRGRNQLFYKQYVEPFVDNMCVQQKRRDFHIDNCQGAKPHVGFKTKK